LSGGVTRRSFLRDAAVGAASLGLARAASGAEEIDRHHLLIVLLHGGVDSVLTVDPKEPSGDLEIELGYHGDGRIQGKRRLYGPLIGDLLRHEEDLCLIHGVRVDTTAHPDGVMRFVRGAIQISPNSPFIGEVLGASLPGDAPIPFLEVAPPYEQRAIGPRGRRPSAPAIPAEVARSLFSGPARPYRAPAPSDAIALAYRKARAQVLLDDPAHRSSILRALDHGAALRRLFATMDRGRHFSQTQLGVGLGAAFEAIRTNTAKCCLVASRPFGFDTHSDNLRMQTEAIRSAYADLGTLLDRLKGTRLGGGTLFDRTTILIGSELGRFPRLNGAAGKDHWPENSMILTGRGVRRVEGGLTIGATDRRYQGQKVNFASGEVGGDGARSVFFDSVFATLIRIAGGSPNLHGFDDDDVLRCAIS
jgi:hypothetical protein